MNKFSFVLAALFSFSALALTGQEIIDKSTHLDTGKTIESRTKIRVTETNGKTKDRDMWIRRKKIGAEEASRIEFTAPADIKGLSLLMIESPTGETEQHLYTPALRRIRRIRGSLKSQEFADTDFTYEDMERRNIDNADHELDGEETVDGHVCYKIISKTKKNARSQYGKSVAWVDKENFLLRKLELYDRGGEHIKTLRSLKSELISEVWTQMLLEMENVGKKRKTTYEVKNIQYETKIDSGIFTTSSLGQ